MSISTGCIPANPDISGIGVRTAVYAQNLLTFVPALYTLADGIVTPTEIESLETQSSTILISAFALLLSTIIEVLTTEGLTNYHVTVILNLSWINNTNTFIYLILYFYRKANIRDDEGSSDSQSEKPPAITTRKIWMREIWKLMRNPVPLIGSVHLSLMAAVGIWLWSKPSTFGQTYHCDQPPSVVVMGGVVPIDSEGLQIWSLFIYSLFLVPGVNLIIPSSLFLGVFWFYHHFCPSPGLGRSIKPVLLSLALLVLTVVLLLVDTERAITANQGLLQSGDGQWTFGQTLSLVLLLVPLRDIGETLWERRSKQLGQKLLRASKEGVLGLVKDVLEDGAPVDMRGMKVESTIFGLWFATERSCQAQTAGRQFTSLPTVDIWRFSNASLSMVQNINSWVRARSSRLLVSNRLFRA